MDEGGIVNPDFTAEEQALRAQVEKAEEVLRVLQGELRAANRELEGLVAKSSQFEVLGDLCRSLEALDSMGAGHLFWSEQGATNAESQLQDARRRLREYDEAIQQAEQHRQGLLDRIGDHNLDLDDLQFDLSEAMERAEIRQNEWLVEREADVRPQHAQVMPWARNCEEDQRYRRSLGSTVAASFVLAVLISSVAIPIAERSKKIEVPERVAKLVREERKLPPPAVIEEKVVEEEIPEPEPELAEETPPKEVPEANEKPAMAAVQEPELKEQVRSKGILAFRDSFANRASLRPTAQLGSQARVRAAGDDAVGRPQRSMVTTNAPGSSGGINLADISRDVGGGGGAIAGVEVSRVASSIGSGGSGSAERPMSGGAFAGRTDEEIQIVFDRYKAALYRLYNRELRRDPTLRGQMVLKLTIEPDGSVSFCALQNSNMNAPMLAEQVVERVRTFDFGAKEGIVSMTIIYPIDFLPAA